MARRTTIGLDVSRRPVWHNAVGWIGRGLWRARWHLLPAVVFVVVPVVGLLAAAGAWLLGVGWVAAAYAVAGVVATAWIVLGLRDPYDRLIGAGTVVLGGVYSLLIAAAPFAPALWLAWPLIVAVVAPAWWWGPTIKARVDFDQVARRFARSKLAEDGGHLVALATTAVGRVARVRLGRRWQANDREELADVLDAPDGAVIADPDPRTRNRSVHVTVLDVDKFGGPELPHPALADGAMVPGGPWAPGSRTIDEPLPLGERRDGRPATVLLHGEEGARHGGIFGKSGAGKSGTVSVLVAGVAACRDARMIGSDAVKSGGTLKPWADVLSWPGGAPVDELGEVPALALTIEDTERQMRALLDLVGERCGRVADSDHDNHVATEDDPAGVYVIEELAALLNAKPELDDLVVSLVSLARQAGVSIVIVSQGGDWDSIPTKVRDNIMWRLVHRMEPKPMRLVAPELVGKADMSLFDVGGLLYQLDDREATDPMPVRAHALYRNPDKRRVANVYRRRTSAGQAPRPAPAPRREPHPVDARRNPREVLAAAAAAADAALDAAEGARDDRPLGEVFASVPPEVEPERGEDEEVTARVVDLLGKAPDGLSKRELAAAAGVSPETVLRRLTALRAAGRVDVTGNGSATRWVLVREQAAA